MGVTLCAAKDAGPSLLKGRYVMLATDHITTPEALRDWLVWHHRFCRANAALIPVAGAGDAMRHALAPLQSAMEIALVDGTPTLEDLRHGFLAEARAVLAVSAADLVMPDRIGPPFARVQEGHVRRLIGRTVYPWRLRQGNPAHLGDHVAVVPDESPRFAGWCVCPTSCPDGVVWQKDDIDGMSPDPDEPNEFLRAMGIVQPGVTIGQLVRKSDLVEDVNLLSWMTSTFRARPPAPQTGKSRRGASAEKRQVTLVTAMKNEGPFILDWVAHHRSIGIERFLVYTNDCNDATEALLDALAEAGVEHRDNPFRETGNVPQHAAFRAAQSEPAVKDADWLVTLDVDEYLNIHVGDGTVADLFSRVPDAGAISLPWRLFGNAHVHEFTDTPVTQQFTLAAPDFAPSPLQAWAFKTLYRNDGMFRRIGVHRPKGLNAAKADVLRWVDGTGRDLPERMWRSGWRMTHDTWGYDLATVNHYAVRSAESFLVKRDRGRVNHVNAEQGTAYWFRMNHNVTEETSIRRFDARTAAERARLAEMAGVAEAHEASVDWHRARIAELKDNPEMAEFYAEITGPRLEKLSRMTMKFGKWVFYRGPDTIPDDVVAMDVDATFYFSG